MKTGLNAMFVEIENAILELVSFINVKFVYLK